MMGEGFRDTAPMSAAQAATIILDGVRADEWRILVGDDAKRLDERGAGRPLVGVRPRRHRAHVPGRHRLSQALVADLRAALAPDRVRDGALERSLYERDASDLRGDAAVVCFPLDTAEVQACVRAARRHGRPFVARGAGTGLAGGATPVGDPVVIVTTKMDRVLSIDDAARVAWVEPGVINLDLNRQLAPFGLHFAPDPSSQQACTVGGNVANNSGGPHCLASGVTERARARPGGRAARRRGRDARWARSRAGRLRPAGRVRRERGHARHRHPHRGAADVQADNANLQFGNDTHGTTVAAVSEGKWVWDLNSSYLEKRSKDSGAEKERQQELILSNPVVNAGVASANQVIASKRQPAGNAVSNAMPGPAQATRRYSAQISSLNEAPAQAGQQAGLSKAKNPDGFAAMSGKDDGKEAAQQLLNGVRGVRDRDPLPAKDVAPETTPAPALLPPAANAPVTAAVAPPPPALTTSAPPVLKPAGRLSIPVNFPLDGTVHRFRKVNDRATLALTIAPVSRSTSSRWLAGSLLAGGLGVLWLVNRKGRKGSMRKAGTQEATA